MWEFARAEWQEGSMAAPATSRKKHSTQNIFFRDSTLRGPDTIFRTLLDFYSCCGTWARGSCFSF